MAARRSDLLQGTLDLLVLKILALGPQHGWAISQRIEQVTQEALKVNQGSLYPSLHRLERQGWIVSAWRATEEGRRARFYSLTRAGRAQLAQETENWQRLTEAVGRILKLA